MPQEHGTSEKLVGFLVLLGIVVLVAFACYGSMAVYFGG